MYAGDMSHPKALDWSKVVDLMWDLDFLLTEWGRCHVVIQRRFIIYK